MAKTGKAYGFFDCRASKQEIEAELPYIREFIETTGSLELSLGEVRELEGSRETDSDLLQFIRESEIYPVLPGPLFRLMRKTEPIKLTDLCYVLKATYPDATNIEAADELVAILNQAYNSSLYNDEEPFYGAIVYKEKGEYVFRE